MSVYDAGHEEDEWEFADDFWEEEDEYEDEYYTYNWWDSYPADYDDPNDIEEICKP